MATSDPLDEITDPLAAAALTAEEFYSALTSRNRGLIDPADQVRLRDARLAVLGCGSTGGGVVEPLVRTGATRLALADPGTFDLGNLNRQQANVADLGRNKAVVHAERVVAINPHAVVACHPEGLTPENADILVGTADLVLDAVDVTTDSGLQAKLALHRVARAARIPVVCAYDIAGTQFVDVRDYRDRSVGLLVSGGTVSLPDLIPATVVPVEMYAELLARASDPGRPFPQLAMTSTLLGAIFPALTLELLAGRPVRHRIVADLPRMVRSRRANVAARVRQLRLMPRVVKAARP